MYKFAKWCINDSCNLSCPFCLMDHHFKTQSLEEQYRVIDKLYEMGIQYLDFFGKEVLFDERIFHLLEYMYDTGKTPFLSLITNGVNLKKYEDRLLDYPRIVEISVSTDFGISRTFIPPLDIFDKLRSKGIITEFSIDLQKGNIEDTINLIKGDYSDSVYIKPIMPYGERSEYSKDVMVSKEELEELLDRLDNEITATDIYVSIPFRMSTKWEKNYKQIEVYTDEHCCCGNSLYITSDGRVYGCGFLANTDSTRYCDFLNTEIADIKKHIMGIKERECVL